MMHNLCRFVSSIEELSNGKEHAKELLPVLLHRGPDGNGVQAWFHATLIHTRPGANDLSPSDAQPLVKETGIIWIVSNGENSNYRDIQQNFEGKGHIFNGYSNWEFNLDFKKKMVGNKLIDCWECLLWLYMTPNPNGTFGSRPVPSLLHSAFGENRINRGSFGNIGELIAPI